MRCYIHIREGGGKEGSGGMIGNCHFAFRKRREGKKRDVY